METKFSPATQIGRFRVEAEVGQGGMGVVYRCFDPILKRPVALKLLAPHLGSDPKALARFHREAALAASLKHSHIAIVYDLGQYEGQPYIAGSTDLLCGGWHLSQKRSVALIWPLALVLGYHTVVYTTKTIKFPHNLCACLCPPILGAICRMGIDLLRNRCIARHLANSKTLATALSTLYRTHFNVVALVSTCANNTRKVVQIIYAPKR
jgi:serine/threonine protein kinase